MSAENHRSTVYRVGSKIITDKSIVYTSVDERAFYLALTVILTLNLDKDSKLQVIKILYTAHKTWLYKATLTLLDFKKAVEAALAAVENGVAHELLSEYVERKAN